MMKKIGTWVFGILFALFLIGVIFGDDEPSKSKNAKNKKSVEVPVGKYSNLPIKKNLSYFLNPKNITGQVILRTEKSPLSAYEKGQEFGGSRNIREEKLQELFYIDTSRVNAVATAEINSKDFNEFEIDDFGKKLKEEFAKSIQSIRNSYKNIDKHIRIVNLNIPVKYSKESEAVASIKITNVISLQKLNYSKIMLLSDFIKEELDNKYISQYIVQSEEKYNFEALVYYDDNKWTGGIKVKSDAKILNDIGKVNKGNDTITELTLHVWDSKAHMGKSHITYFVITSFKLKSSDKRFVLDAYVNKIVTAQAFNHEYFIKDNDFPMFYKEDD